MNKIQKVKSLFALILALSLLLPMGIMSTAGAPAKAPAARDYTIISPYATVDWDTWDRYKANLHTHSTVSDGKDPFVDVIEAYYARDYDILAMAEHGVVNKGWTKVPETVPILSFNFLLPFMKPVPLTEERNRQITTGADRGGRGMTDIMGIEMNAAVLMKNHVNGFFADYGQGYWGKENDFETVIAGMEEAGGLTHINHPGDWLGSAKDINIAKDPKNIKFFADLLKKYPSCLGLEVLNSHDSPTRHDRVLWDGLLESVIPYGRNVFGFGNSDSHHMGEIDTSFGIFMMPENTVANVRTAMETGTFFACGRRARPELGDSFVGEGAYPVVTNIKVDNTRKTITLQGEDYDTIEWIAKGEIIATGEAINLREHENEIGCYVRAQLKGPGGICFTQAFIIDDGTPPEPEPEESFIEKWINDFIFAVKSTRIYVIIAKIVDKLS